MYRYFLLVFTILSKLDTNIFVDRRYRALRMEVGGGGLDGWVEGD